MRRSTRTSRLMLASLTALLTTAAHAQETEAIKPDEARSTFQFAVGGGYEFGFGSDLDGGGDVDISRFTSAVGVMWNVNPDFDLSFRLSYDVDFYDFSSSSALAATEPWDDIHTLGFGVIGSYALNDEWTVFGGPVLAFARESGADWGDSLLGGGVAGVTYKFSKDLLVGGGLGVTTQLEDDPYLFPILILNWQITDSLRVGSQTSGASGRTGIELVWSPSKSWEFALGAANKYSRFRLDDEGVAPDGIGVEDSTPVWIRAGYHVNDHIAIDAIGGATASGEFRLEDSEGHKLSDAGFDTAFFAGVFLKIRF